MGLNFDNKETVMQGKMNIYLSKLMRLATMYDNHNYVIILRKAGLSSYIERFEYKLTPYTYNGKWQNDNIRYAPEEVFDYLFFEIGQEDKEHQYLFLKAIIEQISSFNSYEIDINLLTRYLLLLGYKIIDTNNTEANGYSLIKAGVVDNVETLENTMFENIINTYGNAKYYYDQANSTFINGDYNSTIGSCRELLEIVCNCKTGLPKCGDSIFKLSNISFNDDRGKVEDINQAIKYWCEKRKDVSIFIRLYSLYNCLCEYGSHPNLIPDMNVSFLMLNETKTTIYYLHNINKNIP